MTMNSSGPISLAGSTAGVSIEYELGGGGTTMISLNDTNVRTLAGVASGQIVMPTNFYGKSSFSGNYFINDIVGPNITLKSTPIAFAVDSNGNSILVQTTDAYPYVLNYISNTGSQSWTKGIFSTYPIQVFQNDAAFDSSGNIYIRLTGTGSGSQASYTVIKVNSSGTLQWYSSNIPYNTNGYASTQGGLAIDSNGNIYYSSQYTVSGSAYQCIFLTQLNSSGTHQWTRNIFPGSPIYLAAYQTVIDSSNNIYLVAGISGGTFDGYNYIAKFDSTGALLSSAGVYTSGTNSTTFCYPKIVGSNIIFATYQCVITLSSSLTSFVSAYKLSSGTSFLSFSADSSGNYYIAYSISSTSLLLGKYDSSGNVQSTLQYNDYVTQSRYATSLPYWNPNWNQIFIDSSNTLYASIFNNVSGQYSASGAPNTIYFRIPTTLNAGSYLGLTTQNYGAGTDELGFSSYSASNLVTQSATFNSSIGYTANTISNTSSSNAISLVSVVQTQTTVNISSQLTNGYGSTIYSIPGTYSWVCPTGVTSVSVVCVGASGTNNTQATGGAGLGYKNNYSVTAGNSYTVQVGNPSTPSDSYFVSTSLVKGGGVYNSGTGGTHTGDGGGNGGTSNNNIDGGGAGGYTGAGGNGGTSGGTSTGGGAGGNSGSSYYGDGGGGVGIFGNTGNATHSSYGGSGGLGGTQGYSNTRCICCTTVTYYYSGNPGTYGGGIAYVGGQSGGGTKSGGAVRIIWPGASRTFPSTNVGSD